MSGPEPPEMSGPKPPEMSGPEPPEMSGPKPPEMSGPEPPEMSGPKPPEMSGPEPPETSGPEPRETPDPKTRKVMKTPEEIFEEFRMKGYSLVQAGDFERALHCYSQCIKSCPSRVTGYTNRALCFLKLNRPGLAEEDCIKALEMDKKNVKGLYRRALARKALKRYSEAAKDLHQLLQIDSNNTAAKAEIDVVKDLWRKDLKNPVSTKNGESSSSRKTSKRKNKAKKKKISIEEVCSEVPKVLLEGGMVAMATVVAVLLACLFPPIR
jgi:cytochrome c-type biogenesis protein CcmH/NrfG